MEELPNIALPVPQVQPDELPREFGGGGAAPPPPGTYGFVLPENFAQVQANIKEFDVRVWIDPQQPSLQGIVCPKTIKPQDGPGRIPNPDYADATKTTPSKRVMILFNDESPLRIASAPDHLKEWIGQTVMTSVSSMERNMARQTQTPVYVAATTYLLKAVGATNIYPTTIQELKQFLAACAGKHFKADVEWRGNCSADREARIAVDDGQGGVSIEPKLENGNPAFGCGAVFYQRDWPRDDNGQFYSRINCSGKGGACRAVIYPMAELRRFKPAV